MILESIAQKLARVYLKMYSRSKVLNSCDTWLEKPVEVCNRLIDCEPDSAAAVSLTRPIDPSVGVGRSLRGRSLGRGIVRRGRAPVLLLRTRGRRAALVQVLLDRRVRVQLGLDPRGDIGAGRHEHYVLGRSRARPALHEHTGYMCTRMNTVRVNRNLRNLRTNNTSEFGRVNKYLNL